MNPDVTTIPALSRRSVILNTGVAAAALAGLSACGSGSDGGTAGGGASSAAAPSASSGSTTVKAADIPVGSGKIFADSQTVVTQPTKGDFKAFSSICTHQKCPVTEVTTTIDCKCHGSKFSLTDGSVVNPPATQPLPAKTVTVNGDSLTIA